MKRAVICLSFLALFLTGCAETTICPPPSGRELLEMDKNAGYVVFEDSVITAGQEVWDDFLENTQSGKPAEVWLTNYYTLDEERVSPEYYEAEKDNYPKIFTQGLSYDGKAYTVRYDDEDGEHTETYQYLERFDEYPYTNTPEYRMVIYMLVNDETVTYADFMRSIASSDAHAPRVEAEVVYYTLVYDKVLQGATYSNDPDGPSDKISFDLRRKIFCLDHDLMSSLGVMGFFTIEDVDIIRCVSNDLAHTYLFRILDNDTIAYIKDGSDEIGFVEPLQDGAEFKRAAD